MISSSSLTASFMMVFIFACSTGKIFAVDDGLFARGRRIQGCHQRPTTSPPTQSPPSGGSSNTNPSGSPPAQSPPTQNPPITLTAGTPSSPITLSPNQIQEFIFPLEGLLTGPKCSATGTGNVQFFMCSDPIEGDCSQDPNLITVTVINGETLLELDTLLTVNPWYVFVKAGSESATVSVTCTEVLLGGTPIDNLPVVGDIINIPLIDLVGGLVGGLLGGN